MKPCFRRSVYNELIPMKCAHALALLVVAPVCLAQQPKKLNTLHDFSASLEALARRVNRGVVKIVSIGYSIGADEEDSANTSVLTRQRSLGTGVLLTADGYIVTNAHVVQGSRRLRVQLPATERETSGKNSVLLPGGRVVDAKVVGADRETDLAVIKVEEKGLSHL